MIYLERTITVNKSNASIDEPIILYKGDKNVEVQINLKNSPFKYKSGIETTYGQLIIKRQTATPIFSDVARLSNNRIVFVITGDMIDELHELGDYDIQIRLFNADKTSRATIPPVISGISIKEPICEEEEVEDEKKSEVNTASVNTANAEEEEEQEDTFDEDGNYNKTVWQDGMIITDVKLNKIEDAIHTINNSFKENQFIIDATDQEQTLKKNNILITTNKAESKIYLYNSSNEETIFDVSLGTSTFNIDDDIVKMAVTNAEQVKINGTSSIEALTVQCDNLTISNTNNLQKITLIGNICDDAEAMTKLAEGLVDRNDRAWGSIITQNQNVRREVEDAFIQKDWYFGTDKTVNNKLYQFGMMNIQSIWESAEYGEGRVYAVADTEIDDGGEGCTNPLLNEFDNTNISSENYLGKFNFCTNESSYLGTQHHHGLAVLSVIAMNGTSNMWGIAPKAQFYMFKLCTKTGSATPSDYYRCIAKATELELDALNISVGTSSNTTTDETITSTNKSTCITFANTNGVLCFANGNEGTNVYNEDGTVTSIHEGIQYPHNGSWSIAIGSIRKNEQLSDFSTCCDGLDFLALSGNTNPKEQSILTRYPKGTNGNVQHAFYSGTSLSSPLIMGCVLLMKNLFYKKYKREATMQELVEYMSKRTRDIGLETWQQGYGIFDFMAYNPNPRTINKKQ